MKLGTAISQHSALTQKTAVKSRAIKVVSHFLKPRVYMTDNYEPGELKLSHVTSPMCRLDKLIFQTVSWWSEGITIARRIKSRDAQSNGQIFLSHRVLQIFRTTTKSYRGQSLLASILEFMYRAVKSTKICSVPRIFKTKCKLFMCAKGEHKRKRNNSPCWPQNLAEQSSGNNLLNSRI